MNTHRSTETLMAVAQSWVGTPFCEMSAVKGAGVCCHQLMLEVLVEAAWLPRIEVPNGSRRWAEAQGVSLMIEWFAGAGSQWFIEVPIAEPQEAGDILGFRLGRSLHHLVMRLPGENWMHVVEGSGVVIAPEIAPRWMKRLERVWRVRA
jgi:hypothetical protein